jgi:uncharacterized membrane protein YoaK (UPF0700 family)
MKRIAVATAALGFIAGYVDTVGFIALFGLFTAHVTGNFVLIGVELARPGHGVLLRLLAFPAFIAGIVLARLLVLQTSRLDRHASTPLLLLEGVLLAACVLAGARAVPFTDTETPAAIATGVLAAAAMGVQNAAGRIAWSALIPTTVMTGNVTQLVIDAVDLVRGAGDAAVRERFGRFVWPVLAFGAGAIAGGFGWLHAALLSLLLPLAMLAGLALTNALEPPAPAG